MQPRVSAFAPWRPDVPPPHHLAPPRRPHHRSDYRYSVPHAATTTLLAHYRRCNPEFRFLQSVPRRCLTRPSEPAHNNDFDNRLHDYILHVNDRLADERGDEYAVLDLLGTGTFGQVVKCCHERTGELVAVKVIKNQPAYFNQAWVEINILRMLHQNNSQEDTRHVVKFYSHFIFREHLCLVFERLSINLYELLKQNSYVGVSLEMLRSFLSQILGALDVLVRSEVIHCDLKPENILLKTLDTAQLKLIDFGSACQLHYPVYSYVQSRFYRSPEILLGAAQYDSKIDMWSLGCVAGELFLGIPLFPGQNEMNMICRIVEMLGDMPDRFLRRCRHTSKFFNCPRGSRYAENIRAFQVKPLSQYERETGTPLPEWKRFFKEKKLRDIIMAYPHRAAEPHTEDIALRESLVDLLSGMLKVDPGERWTPAQALQHPFIDGKPLPNGQPWSPPFRGPVRIMRSRPMHIDQNDEPEPTPVDEFYSASAPNFGAMGHLSMNTTWGTGAGGQPVNTRTANGGFQLHHQAHHNQHHYHAASGHDRSDENGSEGQSFAPGSYIPSSTMNILGSSVLLTGPRRGSMGGLGGSYGGNNSYVGGGGEGASGGAAGTGGTSIGPGSYEARAFLFPSGGSGRNSAPRSISGVGESPSTVARGATSPGPYATAFRFGSSIHMSGSRESLTGSLRMSGSRESLGIGRVPSVGDMGEDPMFPFGSDDEALSPAQGAPSPSFLVSAQQQQQLQQQQHHAQSSQQQSSGIGLTGASAALPPPGPRFSHGRPGAAAAYGQPSTLSSYGYTYTNQNQTRAFDPTTGHTQPTESDVGMLDMKSEGESSRAKESHLESLDASRIYSVEDQGTYGQTKPSETGKSGSPRSS